MKTLLLVISILGFSAASAQVFEKYKLLPAEIPAKYKASEEMLYKSIQPEIFYDNPDLYQGILGKVKSKDFQSFDGKGDQGTVLFFEYEDKVKGEGFLEGLLWGGSKPTKEHPEEYLIKDNILIIWSFEKKSEIKNISRQKIKSTL
jgi:hypothetical protein